MGGGGYIPRFRNLKNSPKAKDFIRGYAVDFYSGSTPDAKYFPSYGEQLAKDLASASGACTTGRRESVARAGYSLSCR